ncbi:MAG: ParA family protein, partial [Candidatus Hodarchaeales archaeon]
MKRVFMFHSYKGGTGKSLISINVAVGLVKQGYKVALFDFDFLGPGLFSTFVSKETQDIKYLNDLFFKPTLNRNIKDTLMDVSHESDPEGSKLFVGLANPDPAEINSMLRLTKAQSMEAFRNILIAQEYLFDELNVDYLIIDAGPGFRFDVANAMMISDVIISVMKPSESDLAGTKRLLKSISAFVGGKLQGIVINRAVSPQANPGYPIKNLLKSRQE